MSKEEVQEVNPAFEFLPVPSSDQQEEIKKAALATVEEAARLIGSAKFPSISFLFVELDESNADRQYTFKGNLPPPQFAGIAQFNARQYVDGIRKLVETPDGVAH